MRDPSRDVGIDVARSLAIISVVATHALDISVGRWGVQLFFIVSGYLLAEKRSSSLIFLTKRAFRLYPLTIVFIFLFYLNQITSNFTLFLNMALIQNATWKTSEVPGLWSISNELIFSIIVVFLWHISRIHFFVLLLTTILVSLGLGFYVVLIDIQKYLNDPNYYAFLSWLNTKNPIINLSFFLIGFGINKGYLNFKLRPIITILLTLTSVIVHYVIGHIMLLWVITLTCIFVSLSAVNYSNRFFSSVASNIGKTTFGIYFSHFVVINSLSGYIRFTPTNSLASSFLYFIFIWLLSWLIANALWIFVELPCIKLGSRISKGWSS